MNASLLARLIEAGTPAELVGEVAMELARAQAIQEAAEKRKTKDRERKRNSVESTESAEIVEIPQKGSPEVSPQTPLPNPSQISPLSPPKSGSKIELPDWLPAEAWSDFVAMRRKMRNVPFEAGAQRRLLAKLERLRSEGHDPEKLLSKAVERGYRTVFEGDDTRSAFTPPKTTTVNWSERADWYERHGQADKAAECRRKAIAKEQGFAA